MKTKPNTSTIRRAALCAALIVSVALTGCETPAQSALLGGAIGAGAGYIAGTAVQNNRNHAYNRGYRDSRYDRSYDSRGTYYSPGYRSDTYYSPGYRSNTYYYDRGYRHF